MGLRVAGIAVAALCLALTPIAGAGADEQQSAQSDPVGESSEVFAPSFDSTIAEELARLANDSPQSSTAMLAKEAGLLDGGPLDVALDDGLLSTTVSFAASPSDEQLAELAKIGHVRRVLTSSPAVVVEVSAQAVEALQGVTGVVSVDVNLVPQTAHMEGVLDEQSQEELALALDRLSELELAASTMGRGTPSSKCREIPAVANTPLRVDEAQRKWKVNGAGIRVGILSLSYDQVSGLATNAAADVAAGLLPGPGNPCGYTKPVRVLHDGETPKAAQNDEARAMAQIVHAIAPGAELIVSDVGTSPQETAENILELAAAGADIIVDDIFWSTELNFQKGIVSQAVEEVKSRGVVYFASSGNNNGMKPGPSGSPDTGYPLGRHQSNIFTPTECPEWVVPPRGATSYDCLDFSPNGQGVAWGEYRMASENPASVAQVMQWSEPAEGVTTNLQLQLYGLKPVYEGGLLVGEEPCLGRASMSNSPALPVRTVQWSAGAGSNCPVSQTIRLVVLRDTSTPGYQEPTVQITPFAPSLRTTPRDRQFFKTQGNNTLQGSQYGHHGDSTAASVAAAPWTNPTRVQTYSSLGANQTRYGPYIPGSIARPLENPIDHDTPAILGLDGIITSFFGDQIRSGNQKGKYAFYGTSAAAPTIAGVAALGLALDPSLSPEDLLTHLKHSADGDVFNPYSPTPIPIARTVGAGLANADAFLESIPHSLTVARMGGQNRYGTNALVNAAGIRPQAPVFVATGANFADALTIGPVVAQREGTLFLATRTGLSADALQMVKDNAPRDVFLIGGTDAVSRETEQQLRNALPASQFERISGKNRYATSQAILDRFYSDTPHGRAFLATGADYPDALSASAAGGALDAPVVLVKGSATHAVPHQVKQRLQKMGVEEVLIAGGTSVVGTSLETDAKRTFRSVKRLAGTTRYGTNMAVNEYLNSLPQTGRVSRIWMATGKQFPDALSAAVPAGAPNARLVLSNGECVPSPVVTSWIDGAQYGRVNKVRLAGGTKALGPAVQALAQCNTDPQ